MRQPQNACCRRRNQPQKIVLLQSHNGVLYAGMATAAKAADQTAGGAAILERSEMDHTRDAASGSPNTLPPEHHAIGHSLPDGGCPAAQLEACLGHFFTHPDRPRSELGTVQARS